MAATIAGRQNSTGVQKTRDSGRPFQRPADNAAAWTINVSWTRSSYAPSLVPFTLPAGAFAEKVNRQQLIHCLNRHLC